MPFRMKFRSFGKSDIGRKRSRNEDAFLHAPESRIFAVADGLGGLSAGDQASRIAIETVKLHQRKFEENKIAFDFFKIFLEANDAIRKLAETLPAGQSTGSTLTILRLFEEKIEIGHVGDSAVFLFGEREWKKLTTDHTMAEKLRKDRPDLLIPPIYEHTLTRCLGQKSILEPDLIRAEIYPGDSLFLCTDGVTLVISPDEIHEQTSETKDQKDLVE